MRIPLFIVHLIDKILIIKLGVVIMKMLTTQVNGLLQRIIGNNEDAIEETARLLAQATFGEGRVILATFGEMQAVLLTALHGTDTLQGAVSFEENMDIGTEDRVWIITKSISDDSALELAQLLANKFIPFAAIAAEHADDNELETLASTYISTGITKGLLPGENGERFVQPHALAALFIYEAVKISYDEMLEDE